MDKNVKDIFGEEFSPEVDEMYEKFASPEAMAKMFTEQNRPAECTTDESIHIQYSEDGKKLLKYDGEDVYHIEDGTMEICDAACARSKSERIYIPETVTRIGINAFFYSKISDIVIPSSVNYIGGHAFQDCKELENVEFLSTSIETINERTFNRCPLKIMVVPEGVKKIGKYAFAECVELVELYLPSTLQTLEYCAFAECSKLKEIHCAAAVPPTFPEYDMVDENRVLLVENMCFGWIKQPITLYVPKQSIPRYKANSTWNKFTIRAME